MRRSVAWPGVIALFVVVMLPQPALAPDGHFITIKDNEFDPDRTEIIPIYPATGLAVEWDRDPSALNDHNVREDGKLFYSGLPTDEATFHFQRRFSAGIFHYYCEVHRSQGMDGLVRARPLMEDAPDGRPFTVRWASSETNTGQAFDVRYRVDDGPWQTWRTDTERFAGVFGRNGNPVRVRPGHEYDFKARSQKRATTPDRVSRWSPILEVAV